MIALFYSRIIYFKQKLELLYMFNINNNRTQIYVSKFAVL